MNNNMSGSHDKNLRATQRALGTERHQRAIQKTSQAETKRKTITAVIAVIVVIVIAAAFTINSNLFYTGVAAVTIDGRGYTTAEFNYYYFNAYQDLLNNISGYESMYNLNKDKPLTQQLCPIMEDEKATWADYFKQQTLEQLKVLTLLLKTADEQGITISQENLDKIDSQIETLEQSYSVYGYSSANQFLASRYGKGFTVKVFREVMERSLLAGQAGSAQYASYTFTQEELDTYYAENKTDLDYFTYRYNYIYAETDDEGNVTDDSLAAAKKTAEAIAKAETDEDFIRLVDENTPQPESADDQDTAPADTEDDAAEPPEEVPNLPTTSQGKDISSMTYFDWLSDDGRKPGDTEVFEDESGCGVIIFLSRDDNSYPLRSVRHILASAEKDGEDVFTDEAKEAAKTKAEEYLKQWQDGEKTEDSFAALANEVSDDSGSNTKGGLYDEIYKGQMVKEFNDFTFDENRKSGDVDIVYGETDNYAGYHVVYYVGEDTLRYCDYLSRTKLNDDAYQDWQTSSVDAMKLRTTIAIHFAR